MKNVPASPPPDQPAEILAKLDAWRRADQAWADHAERAHGPAHDGFRAAAAAVPHTTFPNPRSDVAAPLSTANRADVVYARRAQAGQISVDPIPSLERWLETMLRLAEAADERDAAIALLRREYRLEEIDAEKARLDRAVDDAFAAVIDHPTATPADLAAKLKAIDAFGKHDCPSCWAVILADARLLAEGGRP